MALNSDGTFIYEHTGLTAVDDTFIYEVRDASGGATQGTVTLVVDRSKWQNPSERRDVTGEGDISPLDALVLINYINSHTAPGPAVPVPPDPAEPPPYYDVNGDGWVSAIDVIIIINYLNDQANSVGEGETGAARAEGVIPKSESFVSTTTRDSRLEDESAQTVTAHAAAVVAPLRHDIVTARAIGQLTSTSDDKQLDDDILSGLAADVFDSNVRDDAFDGAIEQLFG